MVSELLTKTINKNRALKNNVVESVFLSTSDYIIITIRVMDAFILIVLNWFRALPGRPAANEYYYLPILSMWWEFWGPKF